MKGGNDGLYSFYSPIFSPKYIRNSQFKTQSFSRVKTWHYVDKGGKDEKVFNDFFTMCGCCGA